MSLIYDPILRRMRQSDVDPLNKGYFLTEAALTAAYPVGEAGWKANIEETDSIWLWDADTAAWVDSYKSTTLAQVEAVLTGFISSHNHNLPLTTLGTSGTITIDRSVSDKFILPPPTGAVILADKDFADSKEAIVDIINGGVSIAFPSSWEWVGGTIPTLQSSGVDRIQLRQYDFDESSMIVAEHIFTYTDIVIWSDVSGAAYESVNSGNLGGYQSSGMSFKPDGTKCYVLSDYEDAVRQYTLSTPWDVSTASYDSVSGSVVSQLNEPQAMFMKDDGTKCYVLGYDDVIYQYTLASPWVISSMSYDSISFNVGSQAGMPKALFFNTDGTKCYVGDYTSNNIYQYTLSTPWDVSTASYDSVSFSIGSQEIYLSGIYFKPDGTKCYIVGSSSDTIFQYSLSTAWDLTTMSYDSVSYSVSAQSGQPTAIYFKPDGTAIYILDNVLYGIFQYSL